jgi:hypothetical protein
MPTECERRMQFIDRLLAKAEALAAQLETGEILMATASTSTSCTRLLSNASTRR